MRSTVTVATSLCSNISTLFPVELSSHSYFGGIVVSCPVYIHTYAPHAVDLVERRQCPSSREEVRIGCPKDTRRIIAGSGPAPGVLVAKLVVPSITGSSRPSIRGEPSINHADKVLHGSCVRRGSLCCAQVCTCASNSRLGCCKVNAVLRCKPDGRRAHTYRHAGVF